MHADVHAFADIMPGMPVTLILQLSVSWHGGITEKLVRCGEVQQPSDEHPPSNSVRHS